jgi:quinol monooxygenase YgiN
MAQEIHTTLYVTIKEGKIEEFKRLIEEMGKAVENNEPGAKRYQFYLNDDETQCVLNESYINLESVLAHLKGHAFLTIFPKIFNICKIVRFEVFVDINEWKLIKVLLMKALAQMGGVSYHFLTGFSR